MAIKALRSLCPFLISSVVISVALSIAGGEFALFFLNPAGWMTSYLLWAEIAPELSLIIPNIISAIIPPLLLYAGLKAKALWGRMKAKDA
jgi:hypothetical protein